MPDLTPGADAMSAGDVQGVPVKALEWHECRDGNYRKGECFTSRSLVSFAPIAIYKKRDGWWLNVDCKTYPSLEAAKAAAQQDYEARIRSALDGDALSKLIAEGMERAMALPAYDSDGDPSGPFDHKVFVKIDAIRAAAAALRKDEEPK